MEPSSDALPYDAVELIQTNGITFIDLVTGHDATTAVPSCPGWTLVDLANHQAGVWNFWSRIVAEGITDRAALKSIEASPRLEGDLLADWLATTHNALYSALVRATTDQPVWTWTGADQDVSWVRRRMTQESSVHLWDAARAVGRPYEVPTAVAADGIDEFLTHFMGRERGEGEMKVGGTVHLHCTDTAVDDGFRADNSSIPVGEWYVSSVKEPTCTFTREHRKGDAAVRGRAHDLLMWLWRRDDAGVEIIGDAVVARRLRAYTDLG